MHIVFATDENYTLPARTAVRSAIANATGGEEPLTVTILCDESVSAESERRFLALSTGQATVRVMRVQNSYKERLHITRHFSHAIYLRYDLPQLFPELEKVLYVDCDLIINGDLREFYATDLSGYYAAVVEQETHAMADYLQEELCFNGRYFNSGVMLMNLEKWRQDDMTRQLTEFTQARLWLKCQDQDTMNVLFEGQVQFVNPAYNVLTCFYNRPIIAALDGLQYWKIIHYVGPRKPWNDATVLFAEIFMRYLSPEDFQICLIAWLKTAQRPGLTALKQQKELLHRGRFIRSLFYEKRVDANGVKRKIKFFGIGLWSLSKRKEGRALRILGIKFVSPAQK